MSCRSAASQGCAALPVCPHRERKANLAWSLPEYQWRREVWGAKWAPESDTFLYRVSPPFSCPRGPGGLGLSPDPWGELVAKQVRDRSTCFASGAGGSALPVTPEGWSPGLLPAAWPDAPASLPTEEGEQLRAPHLGILPQPGRPRQAPAAPEGDAPSPHASVPK